jgi:hypothetical protein
LLSFKADGEIKMGMDGYVDSILASFPKYKSIKKSTTHATMTSNYYLSYSAPE